MLTTYLVPYTLFRAHFLKNKCFNGRVAPRIDLSYQREMEIDRLLIIYSVKRKHCTIYAIGTLSS